MLVRASCSHVFTEATEPQRGTPGTRLVKTPGNATLMLALMAMGLMAIGAGVATRFIAAESFDGVNPNHIADSAA